MSTVKLVAKYVLLVIATYFVSSFLIFMGLNANYKAIELRENTPEQITIDKAEATKAEGRIYGKVKNSSENNLNGKYIKISIYNSNGDNITTEYLKIENLDEDMEKAFQARFSAENATSYEINIVDSE